MPTLNLIVTLTGGNATVTRTAGDSLTGVTAGAWLIVADQVVPYTVAATPSGNTIALTAPYAGSSATGVAVQIHQDFGPDGQAILQVGDWPLALINRNAQIARSLNGSFASTNAARNTFAGGITLGLANNYAPLSIWNNSADSDVPLAGSPGIKVAITASDDSLTANNPISGDHVAIYSIIDTGKLGQAQRRSRIWGFNPVVQRNHDAHVNGGEINVNNNYGDAPLNGFGYPHTSNGLQIASGSAYADSAAIYVTHVGAASARWGQGLHLNGIGDDADATTDSRASAGTTSVIHVGGAVSVQIGINMIEGNYRTAGLAFGPINPALFTGGFIRAAIVASQHSGSFAGNRNASSPPATGGDTFLAQQYGGGGLSGGYLFRGIGAGGDTLFSVDYLGRIAGVGPEAAPSTSGTTRNGHLRIGSNGGGSRVLDFGTSSSAAWLQSRDRNNLATNYALFLNPNGGAIETGPGGLTCRGVEAAPSSSGSTPEGQLRIGAGGSYSRIIDFGTGPSAGWIQSRDSGNYGANYDLALNPNGGRVLIKRLNVAGLPTSSSGLSSGDVYINSGVLTVV